MSISCITYNHAPFIKECLDGFLMQKTSFSFEIIIHDDASTDGTKEIIQEYVNKYPDIFFCHFQSENQYSKGVRGIMARFNFPRCRGKYIALCEGDDYWTDPNKLQYQIDFLEGNPEYSACVHSAGYFDHELHAIIPSKFDHINKDFDLFFFRILKEGGGAYPTCSLVMRKELIKYPEELKYFAGGDWVIIIFLNLSGKIKFRKDKMAIYRIHKSGVYQGIKRDKDFIIKKRKEHHIFFLQLFKYLRLRRKIVLLLFIIWNQISILYIRLKL